MNANTGSGGAPVGSADWMQPPPEQEGLSRYVATLRERIWIIVATTVITTGMALIYVATANKVYEGAAEMRVIPASDEAQGAGVNLPIIRPSSDPTRDVETASRLVTNIDVAQRVQEDLDSDLSPEALLAEVTAEPAAQSNIVVVTAEAPTPDEAADLANSFAEQTIVEQTEELHDYIDAILPELEQQLATSPTGPESDALSSTVTSLQALQKGPDPTLSILTEATPPSAQSSPRPVLSIAGGLFAGLILGVAAAFALQVLDPRVRREEQLRRLIPPADPRSNSQGGKEDRQPDRPLGSLPRRL